MNRTQSPESFYLSRLGPSLLDRKLTAYGSTCRAILKAQAAAGNNILQPWGGEEAFNAYLASIDDILSLPLNRALASVKQFLLNVCALQSQASAKILHERVVSLFVGYFPIDVLAATLIETSPRRFLVLVNEGIVHLLFRTALSAVKLMERSVACSKLDSKAAREIGNDLFRCFTEYAADRPFPTGRSLIASPSGTLIADQIVQWSLRFICAHELGHIMMRSADVVAENRKGIEMGGRAEQASREDEFQADDFAGLCLKRALRLFSYSNDTAEEMRIGVILFFKIVSLNEAFSRTTSEPLLKSHPPASQRLRRIQRALKTLRRSPTTTAHRLSPYVDIVFCETETRLRRYATGF